MHRTEIRLGGLLRLDPEAVGAPSDACSLPKWTYRLYGAVNSSRCAEPAAVASESVTAAPQQGSSSRARTVRLSTVQALNTVKFSLRCSKKPFCTVQLMMQGEDARSRAESKDETRSTSALDAAAYI